MALTEAQIISALREATKPYMWLSPVIEDEAYIDGYIELEVLRDALNDAEGTALFAEIAAWSAETFPASTYSSTLTHLHKEYRELDRAVYGNEPKERVGEEMADIVHLLVQLARIEGIDLLEAVRAKFAANKDRTWQPPDVDGVVEHVREPNPGSNDFPF